MSILKVVGQRVVKNDAWEKVMGGPGYPVNLRLPRMLHAKMLRSPYAHARILKINTVKAEKIRGVRAIITHNDVPKIKYSPVTFAPNDSSSLVRDTNILTDKARFVGDPVAAVAADSIETAEEALDIIDVEYERLPTVFDPEEAMKPGAIKIHDGVANNIALSQVIPIGDVENGFKNADSIFEGTYETQRVHTCHMEPHVCLVESDTSGTLTVYSSTQHVFGLRDKLAFALGLPIGKVRVVRPPYIGGGFGGKLDMGFHEPVAALLSLKTHSPVRMEYTRMEEFITTARHPVKMHLKTGVKKDGTLTARYAKSIMETGAHATHGSIILVVHGLVGFLSRYKCPDQKWEGYLVYTNGMPNGAFRGYGNPQASFPVEVQMDEIADELKIDPIELRLKNSFVQGEPNPFIPTEKLQTYAFEECVRQGASKIGWSTRQPPNGKTGISRRGLGFAGTPIWVSGCQGLPDVCEQSGAIVKINPDGTVNLAVATVDIGGGEHTVLCQIVAEELGVNFESVKIGFADTETVPYDAPTHASRTTYAVGYAVRVAAAEAKRKLLGMAGEMLEANPADLVCEGEEIFVKGVPDKRISIKEVATAAESPSLVVTDKGVQPTTAHKGTILGVSSTAPLSNPSPAAAQFVEVEVNTETGEVRVLRAVSAHDVGRLIYPTGAEGQVEGGFARYGLCLDGEYRF
jgi:xanthine dehydrogenase molybdenum-binding subunit